MKCEYYLPAVVSDLLAEDKAAVAVLESEDKWYGVTYKEDKPVVVACDPVSQRCGPLSREIMVIHATFLPKR